MCTYVLEAVLISCKSPVQAQDKFSTCCGENEHEVISLAEKLLAFDLIVREAE